MAGARGATLRGRRGLRRRSTHLIDPRGVFRGSARRLAANIVAVSSLTKCYGLGPARIGWMLGARDLVERAGHALIASAGALPLSHTRAGLRAFSTLLPLAARSRAILAGKRERVAAWVAVTRTRLERPDRRPLRPRHRSGGRRPHADRSRPRPGSGRSSWPPAPSSALRAPSASRGRPPRTSSRRALAASPRGSAAHVNSARGLSSCDGRKATTVTPTKMNAAATSARAATGSPSWTHCRTAARSG